MQVFGATVSSGVTQMNDITYATNRPADTDGTDGDVRDVQRRRGHNRGLHTGMLAYEPRVDCGPRHDHLLFTIGRVAPEFSIAAVSMATIASDDLSTRRSPRPSFGRALGQCPRAIAAIMAWRHIVPYQGRPPQHVWRCHDVDSCRLAQVACARNVFILAPVAPGTRTFPTRENL